ncbi:VOC family protein [Martelella sp. FLE1502]
MSLSHRPLDHLVLPVVDLATARLRLSALGFAVAPEARHPFGTENACVYFADSTYLEPIAIADQQIYDQNIAKAEFVRRDRAFRFRNGDDGLSAIVFRSEDAEADHADFAEAGLGIGDLFSFSRPYKLADGTEAVAGFRLAFAADLRAPDLFFFTCERLQALAPDETLMGHQNGVTGISGVLLGADYPMEYEPLLQTLTRAGEADIHPDGFTTDALTAKFSVFSHDHIEQQHGIARSGAGRGLESAAVVFEVADLENLADILKTNDIASRQAGDSIAVPPAPGQGVTFMFREN